METCQQQPRKDSLKVSLSTSEMKSNMSLPVSQLGILAIDKWAAWLKRAAHSAEYWCIMLIRRSGSISRNVVFMSLVLTTFLGQGLQSFLVGGICKPNADR